MLCFALGLCFAPRSEIGFEGLSLFAFSVDASEFVPPLRRKQLLKLRHACNPGSEMLLVPMEPTAEAGDKTYTDVSEPSADHFECGREDRESCRAPLSACMCDEIFRRSCLMLACNCS